MRSILIVDDDESIRFSLLKILKKDGHDVNTAASAEEALAFLRQDQRFDLVLLDLQLPGMHGNVVLREIRQESLSSLVVVISGTTDVDDVINAFRSGASDFVRKPFTPDALVVVVNRLLFNDTKLSQTETERSGESPLALVSARHPPDLGTLSKRELEVAMAAVESDETEAVAQQLHISPHTVRNHLKSIYHKLEVHSRAELVRLFLTVSAQNNSGSEPPNQARSGLVE